MTLYYWLLALILALVMMATLDLMQQQRWLEVATLAISAGVLLLPYVKQLTATGGEDDTDD
jgi:hypothetical protein